MSKLGDLANNLIKAVKADVKEAATPENKMKALEAARRFIAHDLPGIWGIIANAVIDGLEATIKTPAPPITN